MLLEQRIGLAHSAVRREQWDAAWEILRDVMNEDADNPAGLYLAGMVMRGKGHTGLAMQMFRRALAIIPKKANVWMHYGACLHDLGRYDEAREAFMVVHKDMPNDPQPIANIASGYTQQGKANEALKWANDALEIEPANRIARIAKGFSSLALGRWTDGWEHLSELYGDSLNVRIYSDPPEPEWDGSADKVVAVQCDQGVGDQIMFSQCLRDMKARKIVLECSARMVPFFRRNFPDIEVHGTLKQKAVDWARDAGIEAHTHISNLGSFVRKRDSDFPRKAYITADREMVEKWRRWLSAFPRPWVGIAWKGGIPQTNKKQRSLSLEQYAPVLAMPGTFIDMSYDDSGLEVSRWNLGGQAQIRKPPIDERNFDDTIALTAALDDVVTVTTTLAHVCGALGRHAYVLVPIVPQWRYAYRIDDGKTCIWYPQDSIRLYRQMPGEQDFSHAINRVVKDMADIRQLRAA